MKIAYRLAQKATPWIPRFVRDRVRMHIQITDYDLERRKNRNPYSGIEEEMFKDCSIRLGIIEEVSQSHKYYITACKEMQISYFIIDILADDWVERVNSVNCDAFLAWPSSCSTINKGIYDNRLYILEQDLEQRVFPSWKECWLTEHKPRLRDWMLANKIPHPKTWVAYRKADAMELSRKIKFPLVAKSATGASGKGVTIIQRPNELQAYIGRIFGKGLSLRGFDPFDKHRGYVFFQKYLPNIEEWRMVRIGDSYFGHRKGTSSRGLHSGASFCHWEDPGIENMNFIKRITDTHNFRSMDLDIFVTESGSILVNELQTTFGCSIATTQMKIDGIEGRYINVDGAWQFEPGSFCQNHMCNLRVEHLVNALGINRC